MFLNFYKKTFKNVFYIYGLHGTAPSYLADELQYTADFEPGDASAPLPHSDELVGSLTCKTVSRMTYTVLVETLNPTHSLSSGPRPTTKYVMRPTPMLNRGMPGVLLPNRQSEHCSITM